MLYGPVAPLERQNIRVSLHWRSQNKEIILNQRLNIACCLDELGRHDEALGMHRDVLDEMRSLLGNEDPGASKQAVSICIILSKLGRFTEMAEFVCSEAALARRTLGDDHEITLRLRYHYAQGRLDGVAPTGISVADWAEANAEIEDVYLRMKRLLGASHPLMYHTTKLRARFRAATVHERPR